MQTGKTFWGLTDHLGSVRDGVDDSGTVRLHRKFDGFGNVTGKTHYNASGLAVTEGQAGYITIDIGYTGRIFDFFQPGCKTICIAGMMQPSAAGRAKTRSVLMRATPMFSGILGMRRRFTSIQVGLSKAGPNGFLAPGKIAIGPGGGMRGGKGGGSKSNEVTALILSEKKTTKSFMEKHGDGKASQECKEKLVEDLTKGTETVIEFAKDSSSHIQAIQWWNGHEIAFEDREYTSGDYWKWQRNQAIWIGGGAVVGSGFKYVKGTKSWISQGGLIYGQGSKQGNRVKHVLDHLQSNAKKINSHRL